MLLSLALHATPPCSPKSDPPILQTPCSTRMHPGRHSMNQTTNPHLGLSLPTVPLAAAAAAAAAAASVALTVWLTFQTRSAKAQIGIVVSYIRSIAAVHRQLSWELRTASCVWRTSYLHRWASLLLQSAECAGPGRSGCAHTPVMLSLLCSTVIVTTSHPLTSMS